MTFPWVDNVYEGSHPMEAARRLNAEAALACNLQPRLTKEVLGEQSARVRH